MRWGESACAELAGQGQGQGQGQGSGNESTCAEFAGHDATCTSFTTSTLLSISALECVLVLKSIGLGLVLGFRMIELNSANTVGIGDTILLY